MTFFQRIAYAWRTYVKLQTFFFFGLGSLVQASVVFPTLFLFSGFSRKRFSRWARYAIHIALKILIWQLVLLRGSKFKVEHRERLKGLHSKIIIANHPSLLDVVLLFSIIPNADCIVKGALGKNRFVSGIVNSIYILNSESFDQQMAEVKRTTDQGNNLIIFPEGTRSEPGKQWNFKKGAARFAIGCKCDVVPIYFGGNEIIGLRKHDKLVSYHPREQYHFYLDVLETISVEPYLEGHQGAQVVALTKEMQRRLEERRDLDPEYPQRLLDQQAELKDKA
jgi:1-acyl-sn-glycerol-3-phosphate acyltransferase